MRALCASVLLLLFLSTPACAPGSKSDVSYAADEAELREIKEVLWPRAYAEQDVELLDRLLGDEFQLVDANGGWTTKAEELAWVAANAPSYDALVFEIKRLDVFENGTAIVAGQGNITASDDKGPYTVTYQSTNVLIKRGGAWKAVASHVSGVERTAN